MTACLAPLVFPVLGRGFVQPRRGDSLHILIAANFGLNAFQPLKRSERAMGGHILVIDQGTTSTRAIVFGGTRPSRSIGQTGIPPNLSASRLRRTRPGGHLAVDLATVREALVKSDVAPAALAGLGIANQRETTLVGDR